MVEPDRPFYIDDWQIDPATDSMSRGSVTVRLEHRHMQVLLLLAQRAGEIVPSREIEDAVWGSIAATSNVLHQAIAQLRRSLGDDARKPRYIGTVARRGYRLIARVRLTPDAVAATDPLPEVVHPGIDGAPQPERTQDTLPTAVPPARAWVGRLRAALSHRIAAPLVVASALLVLAAGASWAEFESRNANRASAQADELTQFMLSVFSGGGDGAAQYTTAQELMGSAAQRIATDLEQHPAARARMLIAIATSYVNLGLGDQAIAPVEEALAIRRRIGTPAEVAEALLALGNTYCALYAPDKADAAFSEALQIHRQLREDSPEVALILSRLGAVEILRGRLQLALERLNVSLELMRKAQGPRHSDVAKILYEVANTFNWMGDRAMAEQSFREAVDILEKSKPALDPELICAKHALGATLRKRGRAEEAAPVLEQTLVARRQLYGTQGVLLADSLSELGEVRFAQGRHAEGEELKREAITALASMGDRVAMKRAYITEGLAVSLLNLGQFAKSEQLMREVSAVYVAAKNERYIAGSEYFLAEALMGQDKNLPESRSLLESSVTRLQTVEAPRWAVERTRSALGDVLRRQGMTAEGNALILSSHRWLSADAAAPKAAKEKAKERVERLAKRG